LNKRNEILLGRLNKAPEKLKGLRYQYIWDGERLGNLINLALLLSPDDDMPLKRCLYTYEIAKSMDMLEGDALLGALHALLASLFDPMDGEDIEEQREAYFEAADIIGPHFADFMADALKKLMTFRFI